MTDIHTACAEADLESAERLYGHPSNWPVPEPASLRWRERWANPAKAHEEARLEHLFGKITQEMRDRFYAEPGQSPFEDAGGAMERRYRAMLGLPVERMPSEQDVMDDLLGAAAKAELNLRISGEISALRLKPGDTILVSVPDVLSLEQRERMLSVVSSSFPGHNIFIMDGGITIEPMRAPPPGAVLERAKRQFDRISQQAMCKDAGAAADLPEAAERYLDVVRAIHGDESKEYRDIHASVKAITGSVAAAAKVPAQ